MFWAPAVTCEISAPPTTPRGTSRSGPGLTTFMRRVYRLHLDLKRGLRSRVVVDLEGRVAHAEPVLEQPLQRPPVGMAVVSRLHDNVRRQSRKPGGDLPYVQVVNLDDARLGRECSPDLLGIEARWGSLHEHPSGLLEQSVGGM